MTVRELIEELYNHEPDTIVIVDDDGRDKECDLVSPTSSGKVLLT